MMDKRSWWVAVAFSEAVEFPPPHTVCIVRIHPTTLDDKDRQGIRVRVGLVTERNCFAGAWFSFRLRSLGWRWSWDRHDQPRAVRQDNANFGLSHRLDNPPTLPPRPKRENARTSALPLRKRCPVRLHIGQALLLEHSIPFLPGDPLAKPLLVAFILNKCTVFLFPIPLNTRHMQPDICLKLRLVLLTTERP